MTFLDNSRGYGNQVPRGKTDPILFSEYVKKIILNRRLAVELCHMARSAGG